MHRQGEDAQWNRTERVLQRVEWQLETKWHPDYGKIETFQGRHVIARDRPVVEGVYLGTYAREAIVVSEVDGVLLARYRTFRRMLGPVPSMLGVTLIIWIVHLYVRWLLPKGKAATERVVSTHTGNRDDAKIDLTVFLRYRAGVCRHRALLAAYFLEKLVKDGILDGGVSVDRNEMDYGGHAWARFVSRKTGRVYITDPGLNECGELFSTRSTWSYRRPEDPPPVMSAKERIFDEFDAVVASVAAAALIWYTLL